MHSITIVGMSRPHLFRRLLESLVQNDLEGWRLLIRIEPTEHAPAFAPIAAELLAGVNYDLRVNDRVLGISENPFLAIDEAFSAGSTLNLHLEEDFVVSPDATALSAWYEAAHRPYWLCLSLLAGPCGSAGLLSNAAHPDLLFEARTFNSIGWAMRREEWSQHARDAWHDAPRVRSPIIHANWRYNWGWDWSLYGLVATGELRTVQPVLARATHTGRDGGTYALPEFHDSAFGKLPVNGLVPDDYLLTALEDLPQDVRSHAVLQDEITTMRMQMENVALGETHDLKTTLLPPPLALSHTPRPPAKTGFWRRLGGRG